MIVTTNSLDFVSEISKKFVKVVARNKGLTDLEPPGTDLFDELLGLEVFSTIIAPRCASMLF